MRTTIVALAAIIATVVALAQPAGAVGSCTNRDDYVICFTVTWFAPRTYAVHIGLDVAMSRDEAQRLIDTYGDGTVVAIVKGLDGWESDLLFGVPLTWVAATDSGLSAELDVNVTQDSLNEDDTWYDRRDEIVAIVGPARHTVIYSEEIHAYF
ncbi:MAG: hypothetical protein AB7W59_27295 [Acidimicrobiia bacterium]